MKTRLFYTLFLLLIIFFSMKQDLSCESKAGGISGMIAMQITLQAPVLLTPLDYSANVPITATLDWSDVEGAMFYILQVSQDSTFASLIINVTLLPSQYTMPGETLLYNTTYFWKVMCINGSYQSPWSSVNRFTTGYLSMIYNNHGYVAMLFPDGINWGNAYDICTSLGGHLACIANVQENNAAYNLAAADNRLWFIDGANNGEGPWLGGYQPVGSPEPGGGWSWVTGEAFSYTHWSTGEPNNSGGNENRLVFFGPGQLKSSFWNDLYENNLVNGFMLEFEGLFVPMPSKPANFSTGISLTPLLDWKVYQDANSYRLQVADNSGFNGTILDINNLTDENYMISPGVLDFSTVYFWRVMAEYSGQWSQWSEPFMFTTLCDDFYMVNITLYMQGLWNGTYHQPYPLTVELRSGDSLLFSQVVLRKPVIIGSSGFFSLDFTGISAGSYWLVVRSTGYMPLAMPQRIVFPLCEPMTWNFTISSLQAVGSDRAMIQSGGSWLMRSGELNSSRNINSLDLNILLQNNGKSLTGEIPPP